MKLTANQLRIGNLVIIDNPEYRPKDNGKLAIILAIKEDAASVALENDMSITFGQFYDFLKPIPLTEEWLLRMGAISNPYQDRYELGDLRLECDKTKGETTIWCEKYTHIKFVHQVQNYIYATTGEELTIKELQ